MTDLIKAFYNNSAVSGDTGSVCVMLLMDINTCICVRMCLK